MASQTLVVRPTETDLALPVDLVDRARKYISKSKSDATKMAYESAWHDFGVFCEDRGYPSHRMTLIRGKRDREIERCYPEVPVTPEALVDYLTDLAERRAPVSSIQQKLAAVTFWHEVAKEPSPASDKQVTEVMAGIRRALGTNPSQKDAVLRDELHAMIDAQPGDTLAGIRNRAILLLGYFGAFRRSELTSLNVSDVAFNGNLMTVTLQRSKTDQEGETFTKAFPMSDKDPAYCPVRALRRWLDEAGIGSGPLFRAVDQWGHVRDGRLTSKVIAGIVKGAVSSIDDKKNARQYGAHSLRAGFVTQAYMDGVPEAAIMKVTGHKSRAMLDKYFRKMDRTQVDAIRTVYG